MYHMMNLSDWFPAEERQSTHADQIRLLCTMYSWVVTIVALQYSRHLLLYSTTTRKNGWNAGCIKNRHIITWRVHDSY